MTSSAIVLFCLCVGVLGQTDSALDYITDPCQFGCAAIVVDDSVDVTCVDDEGAPNNCSECAFQDAVATISCKPGYEINPDPGYKNITCNTEGDSSRWSDPVFSCAPEGIEEHFTTIFGCQGIQEVTLNPSCENGKHTIPCNEERLPQGTIATLTCKEGYNVQPNRGYDRVTCGTHKVGEWSNAIYRCTPALVHPNLHLINADSCGLHAESQLFDVRQLNIGNAPSLRQLPWMAALKYKTTKRSFTSYEFYCSGSIISSRYVLSAASCVDHLKPTDTLVSVQVGATELCSGWSSAPENCTAASREILVSSTVVHPLFNPQTMRNNVALLRLAEPIDLGSVNQKSICLPVADEDKSRLLHGDHLTVAGWGLSNSRKDKSATLQVTDLPVVTQRNCKMKYTSANQQFKARTIVGNVFCFGGTDKKDSCIGDRGGPLVHLGLGDLANKMVQYGIGSFAPMCNAEILVPSVVTRVAPYVGWILDNIRE